MQEISILDLDQVSASEQPFDFQVKDASGNPMALYLQILGDDAEKVQKFTSRKVNEDRRNRALAIKKGKLDEYTALEADIAFTVEACVVRTVGWIGAKEQFSPELARKMFERNKHIRQQVLEESANAANFTPKKDAA